MGIQYYSYVTKYDRKFSHIWLLFEKYDDIMKIHDPLDIHKKVRNVAWIKVTAFDIALELKFRPFFSKSLSDSPRGPVVQDHTRQSKYIQGFED